MNDEMKKYIGLIRENLEANYKGMFREAGEALEYPFLTPGSDQYAYFPGRFTGGISRYSCRH